MYLASLQYKNCSQFPTLGLGLITYGCHVGHQGKRAKAKEESSMCGRQTAPDSKQAMRSSLHKDFVLS